MKKLSTLLLILLSHFCFSQNLVPNPSFEIYDTCPYTLAQINSAVGWSSYSITPDYFNSCAPDSGFAFVSVPSNVWGFHYARTGNAYAGFGAYQTDITNEREYIGAELNQPLVIGQKYYASFWVGRAVSPHPYINIAINKIGMRLSTVAYSEYNPEPTDNHAQVFTDSIIADTLNWIQISGSFIADSVYNYLGIGNFFNDSSTSYIRFDSSSTVAYYYIDDVYLSVDSSDGISSLAKDDLIKIFPNPARDWIAIWGNDVRSLMLYDVLGRIVYASNSEFISPIQINVSFFSRGIYLLKIETKTKSINQRIILY